MKNPLRALVYPLLFTAALANHASADLLTNGNFTSITDHSGGGYTYGQFNTTGTGGAVVLTVNNWATTGYNFVYTPNTVDQGTTANGANTGIKAEAPGSAKGAGTPGNEYMWGQEANGTGNSGLNAFGTNPFAGNFLAADANYSTGPISQSITAGLRTGVAYTLTFYWAVAQQESYTAANASNDWQITLGSQTFTTPQINLPAKSFSGWMTYTNTFTYTGANSTAANPVTLSFLAQSAGSSPPFLLLGNVTLVPEPSSGTLLALVGAGLTAGWFVRRRRQLAAADAQA